MTKKHITYSNDGYGYKGFPPDGYTCDYQLNIRLNATDMQNISDINKEYFDSEITNSTLARILLRRAIKDFKKKLE